MGLTLGLLAGLGFALVKMFGGRSPSATDLRPADEPWPRLRTDPAVPAPPDVALVPDPVAPSPVAPVVTEAVVAPAPAPAPSPAPVAPEKAKKAAKKKPLTATWVEPKGGVCPTSHPVKAKLTSKIFHLPGMLNYERTNPDRCYRDAVAAESDGLRPAKR